ncbi:hypothetical protein HYALB_00001667 [Hymenoscyphus albidus]|uniref:Glycine-rich protein n=1 Tax=Hymenoscyphus albidus TaxID=595503 RepID=A0A9N9Q211_9HELO|nr:hypothetical protein HYALB_00001667 [Hymenoscyphus albidus]
MKSSFILAIAFATMSIAMPILTSTSVVGAAEGERQVIGTDGRSGYNRVEGESGTEGRGGYNKRQDTEGFQEGGVGGRM